MDNQQLQSEAYRLYRKTIVDPCVATILERVQVEGDSEEGDVIHEVVDSALIYYSYQWLTVFATNSSEAFFNETGATSMDGDNAGSIIGQLAYYSLYEDVSRLLQCKREEAQVSK